MFFAAQLGRQVDEALAHFRSRAQSVSVDEQGTEASAATAVVVETASAMAGPNLVVDKPFLFAIRDVATGAILFLGKVADPTAT